MTSLPQVGARAVVENMPAFQSAMDAVNKALDRTGNAAENMARRTAGISKSTDATGKAVDVIRQRLLGLARDSGPVGRSLANITEQLPVVGVKATLAAAGVAVLIGAFVALGQRGSTLVGVAESFDRMAATAQTRASELLSNLREASAGTISNFNLMERANFALAGSSGEVAKMMGEALPRFLEIARMQARATGQDINYLFESLITGVKRGSPLLIDNTGLVLKVSEANERYATSIGKTVEQLTAQEKQLALMQAVLRAGEDIQARLGDVQETSAEKVARINATITNSLDRLAVAVQPAFGVILDAVNGVLTQIDQLVQAILPIIMPVLGLIGDAVAGSIRAIGAALQPVVAVAQQILPYIAVAVQGIVAAFKWLSTSIGNIVNGIVGFLRTVTGNFFGIDFETLVPRMFHGGARMIGSLASGIMAAANQYVFPAVIKIATFIADFLMGLSPPKLGPLHLIDVGGANVMKAWLEGFAGVSLEPVKEVAQQVMNMLGPIATATLDQVNARLAQLDQALKPFENRLSIVQAQFEAVTRVAQLATDGVTRQLDKAVEALLRGEAGSATLVRSLDAQRESIENALDAQQQQVDQYQLQLSLAQALQAKERAMLMIRQSQLTATEQLATAVQKVGKKRKGDGAGVKTPKEKEPKGSGDLPEPDTGGGPTMSPGSSILDEITGQSAVDAARKNLLMGLKEGIDPTVLAQFKQNAVGLGVQMTRIGVGAQSAGTKIGTALDNVKMTIGKKLTEVGKAISDWLDSVFNPDREQSIPWFFAQLPSRIATALGDVGTWFTTTLITPISNAISSSLVPLFDPTNELSISHLFSNLLLNITTSLTGWGETIHAVLVQPVLDKVAEIQASFSNFFTGQGEGTLQGIINTAVEILKLVPNLVGQALKPAAKFVVDNFINPVISVLNALIGAFESVLRQFVSAASLLASQTAGAIQSISPDLSATLNMTSLALAKLSEGIKLSRIAFATVPGAATGGTFGPGLLKVGEHGTELISAASRIAVFPNNVVRALESMTAGMVSPVPYVGGSVVNNSYDNSRTYGDINVHGVRDGQDTARRLAMLRAWR